MSTNVNSTHECALNKLSFLLEEKRFLFNAAPLFLTVLCISAYVNMRRVHPWIKRKRKEFRLDSNHCGLKEKEKSSVSIQTIVVLFALV